MTDHSHRLRTSAVDAKTIEVTFSPRVTQAFANLAAAVHFSEHFDGDILAIVQDLAAGKPKSLHSVLTSLPSIAEETAKHIRETGDKRAEKAWSEITLSMPENGFSLTQERKREPGAG